MNKCLLGFGITLLLSGCVQPDDLLPQRTRNAQQDLRRQPLVRLSCGTLQQKYIASDAPLVLAIADFGGQVAQQRGDLKAAMQKKGCRVPS